MGYDKEYYDNNKDKHKESQYNYLYGCSLSDYIKLLNWQNGCCACCGKQDNGGIYFAIDHNHKTGNIRGLLCTGCNCAVGQVEIGRCVAGLKFEQIQDYLSFSIDILDLEVYNRKQV